MTLQSTSPSLDFLEARDLPSFLPPVSYTVGEYPRAVVIVDLNGDGRRDVAAGGYGSGITIFLGDGTGALGTPTNYSKPSSVFGMVSADVNLDAITDLVSAGGVNTNVLLGNGDGTFQTPIESAGTANHYQLAVGDLNNDGKPDVAFPHETLKGEALVAFGNGDGSFQSPISYPVGLFPETVQIGDLNEDGWNDLTVDNRNSQSLSVLLNRGDGTFLSKTDYDLGDFPYGHTLGDVNKDNHLDAVVANGSKVTVLVGNGDGTFQSPLDNGTGVAATSYPVLADFNRDRKLDVATTSPNSGTVSVLLGKGNGTFQSSVEYVVSFKGTRGIAAGDLNNDRYPDVAATSDKGPVFDEWAVKILVNDAAWSAPAPPSGMDRVTTIPNPVTSDIRQPIGAFEVGGCDEDPPRKAKTFVFGTRRSTPIENLIHDFLLPAEGL